MKHVYNWYPDLEMGNNDRDHNVERKPILLFDLPFQSNTQFLENHLGQRLSDRDVVGVVPAALRRRGQRRSGLGQHGVCRAGDGHDAVTAAIGAATHHDANDRGGSLRALGPSVSC